MPMDGLKISFLQGKYWILDFNPFHKTTDSLLFSWNELTDGRISSYPAGIDIVSGTFKSCMLT